MTLTTRIAATTLLAALGFFSLQDKAQAGEFEHIDRLALQLRGQAANLYHEFRLHYSHARHARHLMSDAADMYYKADHIHDVVHHGGLDHLSADVRDLDRLFHHVEELVDDIEHHARFDRFHGGHIHGDTRHVRYLLKQMEDTLHHLGEDVEELRFHRDQHRFQRRGPAIPRRGGFSFGNGGFRINIGG